MSYRVTSIPRRAVFAAGSVLGVLAVTGVIISDPNGTRPANIALLSVLLVWIAVFGFRGSRCATLLASDHRVTVRGLVLTTSVQWPHIDRFVADTRLIPMMGLPVRVRRRVLGIQMRDGLTRWFPELSCRPAADGSSWVDASVARLNELRAAHPQ